MNPLSSIQPVEVALFVYQDIAKGQLLAVATIDPKYQGALGQSTRENARLICKARLQLSAESPRDLPGHQSRGYRDIF
jgi:hypothetical protein